MSDFHDKGKEHDHQWYHDGTRSESDDLGGGRLCVKCRFRENLLMKLDITTCFKTANVFEWAFREGVSLGAKDERMRLRNLLGL